MIRLVYNVLYYNFYTFYEKYSTPGDNHGSAIISLSVCLSVLIIGPLDIFFASMFCSSLDKIALFTIILGVVGISFLILFRRDTRIKIISSKPKLFDSYFYSKIFSIIFFVITSTYFLWGAVLTKHILDNCKDK